MTLKKLNFFIVEDEDDHAEILAFHLEQAGVIKSIQRAKDGESAVEYLKDCVEQGKEIPDLTFLDLKMPKLNGIEFLNEIKNIKTLQVMPVVMLTTSRSSTDKKEAYLAHANSYLTKPLDFESYGTLINAAVNYWCEWNEPPK